MPSFKGFQWRLFFLLSSAVLGACSVSDRVSYGDQEGPIPEDVIEKIQTTKTAKAWVVAHLGEPFTIDRVETRGLHSQVLYEVYSYRVTRSSVRAGHVMYVFTMGGREDHIEYFHVAFEKDQVKRAWMDKLARAQLGTVLHQEKVKTVKVNSAKEAKLVAKKKEPTKWKLPILKKWFGGDDSEMEDTHTAENPAEMEPATQAKLDSGGAMLIDEATIEAAAAREAESK